ncbi:MAG: cell division protein FtsZ [Acidobacteria bacterium]|nr:cell division protein FtsZ [Acidobacteriota bacterium]
MRLSLDASADPRARIKVIGIGGGGGNAVEQMVGAGIEGVEFIVANTDTQALARSSAPLRLQIGAKLTKGLGAGADPNVGRRAALEDTGELITALDGADMVFVTAGLGGGTGTGAAPVIANLATELGALTVAVVTKPFAFEGKQRAAQAARGLDDLRRCVDTVITIPNERVLSMIDRRTSLTQAFATVDEVLLQAIHGISDLVLVPGLINLDFADVTTIMSRMGLAIMGTGVGRGDTRAIDAAKSAISSPLLEDVSVDGAQGVLVNVTGGDDLTMIEVSEAASVIQQAAYEDANIIFGAVVDPHMEGEVKITVIATGFNDAAEAAVKVSGTAQTPVDLEAYSGWRRPDPGEEEAAAEPAPEPAPEPVADVVEESQPEESSAAYDADDQEFDVDIAIDEDAPLIRARR